MHAPAWALAIGIAWGALAGELPDIDHRQARVSRPGVAFGVAGRLLATPVRIVGRVIRGLRMSHRSPHAVALAAESPPVIPLAPRTRLSPRLPRLVRAWSALGGCMGFGWRLAAGPVTTTVLRHARDFTSGVCRGYEMATHTALGSGRAGAQRWRAGNAALTCRGQAASRRRAFCTDGSPALALASGRARTSTLAGLAAIVICSPVAGFRPWRFFCAGLTRTVSWTRPPTRTFCALPSSSRPISSSAPRIRLAPALGISARSATAAASCVWVSGNGTPSRSNGALTHGRY